MKLKGLIFTIAILLGLSAMVATAQVRAGASEAPATVTRIADAWVKHSPMVKGTMIVAWTPVYAPRSQRIVFWEAKLVDAETRADRGSMTVNATTGKVVEVRSEGLSHNEFMRQRLGDRVYKLVRFSAKYWTAEDASGNVLREFGEFPFMVLDQFAQRLVTAPDQIREARNRERLQYSQVNREQIRRFGSQSEAYAEFTANFDKYFLDPPKAPAPNPGMTSLIDADPDPENSGGGSDTGKPPKPTGMPANSLSEVLPNLFSYKTSGQLSPSNPLNEKWYWSGCGGAAHLNTMIWHDLQFGNIKGATPADTKMLNPLLPGAFWDAAEKAWIHDLTINAGYLNRFRDAVGTFPSITLAGATLPGDMDGAFMYQQNLYGYQPDYVEAYGFPVSESAEQLAAAAIRDFGKPPIIGYWADIHYDVALKVSWDPFKTDNYFYILFEGGTWVAGDDIFYAGFVYDFRNTSNTFGRNHSFERSLSRWKSSITNGGSLTPVVRDTTAPEGSAYMKMGAVANVGTQRLWYSSAQSGTANVKSRSLSLKFRTVGETGARVLIREYNDAGTGAILKTFLLGSSANWKDVSFALPTNQSFTVEIQMSSPWGGKVNLDLDDFRVFTTYHQQQPPKLPCTKKYDEGCDI